MGHFREERHRGWGPWEDWGPFAQFAGGGKQERAYCCHKGAAHFKFFVGATGMPGVDGVFSGVVETFGKGSGVLDQ